MELKNGVLEGKSASTGFPDHPIDIIVKDEANVETMFKLKRSTKMEKVFSACAMKKGADVNSLSFTSNGEAICPDDTPASLDLEDGDQIDCCLLAIDFCVRELNGEETHFRVRRTSKMEGAINAYAEKKGIGAHHVLFIFCGRIVRSNDTPNCFCCCCQVGERIALP